MRSRLVNKKCRFKALLNWLHLTDQEAPSTYYTVYGQTERIEKDIYLVRNKGPNILPMDVYVDTTDV